MCYKDLIDILLNSIQVIGIFVAIVVGLVVSKILSLKTEQSDLKVRISDIDKELLVMEEQLKKKKKENYKYYEENVVYDIIDSIFDNDVEKYDYLSDNTAFVENEYKEKFYNHIMEVLRDAHKSFVEDKVTLEDYKKKTKIKKDSMEELAIDLLYERCE